MRKLWQRYAGRFDALSLRERVMVFAAAATVVLGLAYTLALDAEGARQKRLASALAQRQGEMKAIEDQVRKLIAARGDDPNLEIRQRIAEVGAELSKAEAGIRAEERKFTAPAQMRGVVESLLGRNRAVTLLALRTLPVTSIAETRAGNAKPVPEAAKSAPGATPDHFIFRHGIELSVAGSYLDLLGYVRDLEALPNQLYWGALELDAAVYPKVVMKVIVYTLSLDRAWLSV